MKENRKKSMLYTPLFLIEVYLLFTIFLYQFGPLDWKTENEGLFWFLLIMYHAAFIGGYILSMQKIRLLPDRWQLNQLQPKTYRRLIWGALAVCIICACIEYKSLTHASSYIPYELPGNFIQGLLDPAKQYYSKFTPEGYTSNKLVTALSALLSFIYVSLIPLLVVQWKRLSLAQKITCFAIILFKVVVYVSIGTNKGIFDTMFSFAGILLVLVLLNIFHGTKEHIDTKTFITVTAFTLFLVIFSFTYFTVNISSRVESPVEYAMNVAGQESPSQESSDSESSTSDPEISAPLEEEDPEKNDSFFKRMYYSLSNYLSQGYYGMSLALDEEFTSTYGIGSSRFLMSNFKSLFGIDVKDRTYQHKIDEQWDEDGKWHSFYSYIANDVSFYGVIAVMFVLGLFFGCICKDVFLNDSLIGKLLLPLFVILFMYMPANNQVFTSMATCTAFLELSFLWLLSKFKRKELSHEK